MTARFALRPSATGRYIVGIEASARLLQILCPCGSSLSRNGVPGVGLVSRGIAAVAAPPAPKIPPAGEISTPHAASNHPSGVDGGSAFARNRLTRFGLNAVTHPSWNWSPQRRCENPDPAPSESRAAMSVGNSASVHFAHPGVTYFHRGSPPGLYA